MAQESVLRIVIDSRNAERNAHALANELESIEKKGDFATKSMDSMSVATRQLAGYMAGIVTIGAAINKIDTYTGINNKLKLVTNSQEELNQAMQDTFAIAQKSASSWGAVNDVYSKYMSNAKTLNLTQAQTARLTEITSKAVAISGSTTESAAGALFQYGQALDGNILRGEEYNALVDGAGGLLSAMAKGLGVTRGELRQMMLDGKLTGEVITKALLKAGESVDALYAKTDITIGQSITMLSNQATKFTGEAGKASGAAVALSGSIQFLANNLDAIANITIVGGVAFLTKTIVAQTVAIQGSIAASAQRRAADTAALQSQVQLAAIEVQRTRQVTALAITEVGLARQELNSATTRQARAAATMRLTQAEVALAIAQKQTKVATVEQIAAENALNASRSRGAAILGLVGGWTGALTIGVAALAAGYMYFSNRAAEANKKLEDQANVAKKAKEELIALKGLEKDKAVDDMTASFERQNKALSESSSKINMQLNAIQQLYKGNKEVAQVVQDARNGTISMNDAIQRFNELRIKKDVYEALKLNTTEFVKNAKEAINTKSKLSLFGIEVELAGKKAQTSAVGVDENTQALDKNETAAQRAAKAQKGFFDSLSTDVLSANENLAYLNLGFSKEVIEKIQELQKAKQAVAPSGTTAIVTTEEINQIVRAQKALDAVKGKEDEIAEAKRKQNKEGEKKLKITQAELEVAKRSAALVESSGLGKYAESKGIPSSVIAGLLAQESRGIQGAKSHTGAIGYFQTTSGYRKQNNMSVADSYDLEKSGKIAIDNIAKVYEKTGNLAQAILSHNAGVAGAERFIKTGKVSESKTRNKEVSEYVGKVSRYSDIIAGGIGKGGLSDGDSDRAYEEQIRARLELVKQGLNLQDQYESEQAKRTKTRNEEINLAQQTGQADLIPKIKERYEAQDKLAKLQQEYEVEGYKWTEERKLQYTYETNVLRLTAEGKFSKDQKKIFEKGFKDQRDQEIALVRLAKEQRLFEIQQQFMSETAIMEKRYQLEESRLIEIADLEEREFKRGMLRLQKLKEMQDNLKNAQKDWVQTSLNMGGNGIEGSLYQANLDKENNAKSSENLMNAETAMATTVKEQEAAWQAHADRMLEIDKAYVSAKNQIYANWGMNYISSTADVLKTVLGEDSKYYQAAFDIQKAYAVAQVALNAPETYSNVYKSASAIPYVGPYIAPVMATAAVALQAAQAAAVGNVSFNPTGYANGGYTGHGGKYDPAGIVHKGEGVLTQEEIKALGGPQGFEDLRKSIRRGYSAGGLVADTHRVGMGTMNAINNGGTIQAEKVAQANAKTQSQVPQIIDNQLRVVMVKDESEAKDMLYGPDGEKAFLYHMKRNRSKV